jgi:hypothetical protein
MLITKDFHKVGILYDDEITTSIKGVGDSKLRKNL